MVLRGNRTRAMLIVILGAVAVPAWPCHAATGEAAGEGAVQAGTEIKLDPVAVRRIWRQYWKAFASHSARVADRYYTLPGFSDKYASSTHISSESYRKQNAIKIQHYDRKGRATRRKLNEAPTAKDAAVASHVIPQLVVGEYGYVHSIQIERIIGPKQMIGRWVWLVDQAATRREYHRARVTLYREYGFENQVVDGVLNVRFKARNAAVEYHRSVAAVRINLIGFTTKKLAEGMRWRGVKNRGIQIAIVDQAADPQLKNMSNFVAIPVSLFKAGLKEEQFKAMLAERGFDEKSFCELIVKEKRAGAADLEERVIHAIELSQGEQPQEDG